MLPPWTLALGVCILKGDEMRELTKFENLYLHVMLKPRTKNECANHLGVTTKTIENIVNKYNDILYYNKQHHKYALVGFLTVRIPPILLYWIARDELKKLGLPISNSLTLDISDTPVDVNELKGSWLPKIIEYTQKKAWKGVV